MKEKGSFILVPLFIFLIICANGSFVNAEDQNFFRKEAKPIQSFYNEDGEVVEEQEIKADTSEDKTNYEDVSLHPMEYNSLGEIINESVGEEERKNESGGEKANEDPKLMKRVNRSNYPLGNTNDHEKIRPVRSSRDY